jgi:hypothetical protein
MFGAATPAELNGFLDTLSIDDEERKSGIKNAWAGAADHFAELRRTEQGEPESITTRRLEPSADSRLATLATERSFVSTFSHCPFTFEEVELSKIVASQRTVHMEHVERLISSFKRSSDLYSYCLKPSEQATPVIVGRSGQNSFTASSDNPALRFLGSYEQWFRPELAGNQNVGGQPICAVTLI